MFPPKKHSTLMVPKYDTIFEESPQALRQWELLSTPTLRNSSIHNSIKSLIKCPRSPSILITMAIIFTILTIIFGITKTKIRYENTSYKAKVYLLNLNSEEQSDHPLKTTHTTTHNPTRVPISAVTPNTDTTNKSNRRTNFNEIFTNVQTYQDRFKHLFDFMRHGH